MSVPRPVSFRLYSGLTLILLATLVLLAGCAAGAGKSTVTVHLDSALSGQTVYVETTIGESVTSPGYLVALNAATGKLRWSSSAAGTIGVPIVANGTVYIAPTDGKVYAFAAGTGKEIWEFQRTTGVSTRTGLDGYPTLSAGVLYVDSDGGAVYALDAATGKQRWLYTLPSSFDHIYTAPAVANGVVYVSAGTGLYALAAGTGKLQWKFEDSDGLGGVPTISNSVIYVGGTGYYTLYALNATTGAVLWEFQQSQTIISPPAVGRGMVYVGSTDQIVYAVNAATGQLVWKFTTAGNARTPLLPTGSAVTLAGTTVYAGGQGGGVYALNATTGKLIWSRHLDSAVDSAPALVDGALFVASDQGTVYALRASDGALGWVYHANGAIYASPVVEATG
jgi:outer membrane protein assembly factor BamB